MLAVCATYLSVDILFRSLHTCRSRFLQIYHTLFASSEVDQSQELF
jgi:hypothetical protein